MKSLGALQQLGLSRRRGHEGVLGLSQVGGDLGHAHPESIPEALPRLQRNPGPSGQGALGRGGENTERDGASAGPPQQLADTTAENTLATAPRERLHPGVARYFHEAGLK